MTLGAAAGRRIAWRSPAYIVTQVVAGIAAGAALSSSRWARRVLGHGERLRLQRIRRPLADGYNLLACLVIEVLLTAVFLWVILGATDAGRPRDSRHWPSDSP